MEKKLGTDEKREKKRKYLQFEDKKQCNISLERFRTGSNFKLTNLYIYAVFWCTKSELTLGFKISEIYKLIKLKRLKCLKYLQ